MQETNIKKSFCTTREAADLLGVSVGTVQLWVESGLLQAWKTAGGHRRVLRVTTGRERVGGVVLDDGDLRHGESRCQAHLLHDVDRLLHKGPVPTPADAAPALRSRRLSVLVVEDDANLLRLYEANISRWPMAPEVALVDNAVSALLMMGRNCPDLLLTDLSMPGMDGFSMLRVLRASPEFAQTTIVAVSGLDAAEIEQRGGIPPGIEVLPKPIPFNRMLAIATDIVHQGRFQLPPV